MHEVAGVRKRAGACEVVERLGRHVLWHVAPRHAVGSEGLDTGHVLGVGGGQHLMVHLRIEEGWLGPSADRNRKFLAVYAEAECQPMLATRD